MTLKAIFEAEKKKSSETGKTLPYNTYDDYKNYLQTVEWPVGDPKLWKELRK
jgi:hypothetical protein